ncbi:hypothetical protein N7403_17125 [Pseudomonas nitroreducens]|uniref:hypothetical protein n=1 Tax=Pseudomonas nitroreducens TaxID=46680 RepID=UPI002447C7DE|nr:hypothetical protein [Pseudomonas nitroreducens]MDG9855593.1 hypothetical protein [Pseudomonas nitroreducens]
MRLLMLALVALFISGCGREDEAGVKKVADEVTRNLATMAAVQNARACYQGVKLGRKVMGLRDEGRSLESIAASSKSDVASQIIRDAYSSVAKIPDWEDSYFQSCTEQIVKAQ